MRYLILLLSLLITHSVLAQQQQKQQQQPVQPQLPGEKDTTAQNPQYRQMVQELKLSVQQGKDIYRILQLGRKEVARLNADSSLTPVQKAEQLRGLTGWQQHQLGTLLSPQQRQELGALLQQRNGQRQLARKAGGNTTQAALREFRPVSGGTLKASTTTKP